MPSADEWKALLDDEPDNELVRFSYAKALMDARRWHEAAAQFEALVNQDPNYAIAWAHMARCFLNAGDKVKARATCERGWPSVRKLNHELPIEELEAIEAELDSEF